MYYEKIFEVMQDQKVDYLIAGGMAVNLYGVPRFTKDLDLLIDPSSENLGRLKRALLVLGYQPKVPVKLDDFLNPLNWEKWYREKGMIAFNLFHPKKPIEEIDILIHSPISFEKAREHRKKIRAGSLNLYLISIDDLITMKRAAGREQDKSDIEALEKVKKAMRKS